MGRSARIVLQGSAALGLAAGSLFLNLPSASAEPGCLGASSDFDSDGTPDVVVGIPGGSGRPGAVQVRLSNEDEPFTRTLTGVAGFGTAVTSLSSYADEGDDALCSQLVVGSPDERLSAGRPHSGVVHVYYWDATARQFVSRGVFGPEGRGVDSSYQAGARFGAALATRQHQADDGEQGPDRLYVGAPGFDVDGVRDAGHVVSFVVDDGAHASASRTRTLDDTDEDGAGASSVGGRLGSSLSVSDALVAAGAPGQTVAGVKGAGAVLMEPYDAGPDDFLEELSQATARVPGSPETGDRFGAAVHVADDSAGRATLAVGAPGEDLGRKVDAGTVTVARISTDTGEPVGPVRTVDQDSAGMAGTAEAGDAFGSSVTSFGDIDAQTFLVGSPGEDVGRARDAGMVQTIGDRGTAWTQGTKGVPGRSESGDRMGAALGGSTASGTDQPLIGVPGEDASTGAVIVGLPRKNHAAGYLKGTKVGGRYGFAVAP